MTRLPDWQLRFDDLVSSRQHRPFSWGSHDCALFAADDVHALTGWDPAEGLRGLNAREALRFLKENGGLKGIAQARLGRPVSLNPPAQGDVLVAVNGRGEEGFVVYLDSGVAIAPGADGLVLVTVDLPATGWKVGHA